MNGSAWAVWFVGLPGSGKSSVAGRVAHRLRENGLEVAYLQMDERRRVYFPRPEYTTGERNKAYELFAREAADMVQGGRNVVMDGTAPRVHMRRKARELIARFAEIHIRCSLPTAMQREADRPQGKVMADLYAKALERRETGREFPGLGEVVGVDVPFEEDPMAELRVDNDAPKSLEQAVSEVMDFLLRWIRT